jgi:hypothetical protein
MTATKKAPKQSCEICALAPERTVTECGSVTTYFWTKDDIRQHRCMLAVGHEKADERGQKAHHGQGLRWWTIGNNRRVVVRCGA